MHHNILSELIKHALNQKPHVGPSSAASGNPTYGGSDNGYGAIHVETDTGDIFIYS